MFDREGEELSALTCRCRVTAGHRSEDEVYSTVSWQCKTDSMSQERSSLKTKERVE